MRKVIPYKGPNLIWCFKHKQDTLDRIRNLINNGWRTLVWKFTTHSLRLGLDRDLKLMDLRSVDFETVEFQIYCLGMCVCVCVCDTYIHI